ncbi:hypothetical protein B0H13DRAFT_1859323 [Mycena leptocephala]|nr:hypothetical protein B0H13DRAFT_1859323 [Mycena leptocephala]
MFGILTYCTDSALDICITGMLAWMGVGVEGWQGSDASKTHIHEESHRMVLERRNRTFAVTRVRVSLYGLFNFNFAGPLTVTKNPFYWRRRRRRTYYCGGPNQEQAGTVPTYNASSSYATVVDCPIAVKIYVPHKPSSRPLTKKLGRREIVNRVRKYSREPTKDLQTFLEKLNLVLPSFLGQTRFGIYEVEKRLLSGSLAEATKIGWPTRGRGFKSSDVVRRKLNKLKKEPSNLQTSSKQ